MEEDELEAFAVDFGKLLKFELKLHKQGTYKCGWLEYATLAEGQACVRQLNNRRMDGWPHRLQASISSDEGVK